MAAVWDVWSLRITFNWEVGIHEPFGLGVTLSDVHGVRQDGPGHGVFSCWRYS